jgi:hypothetical protein
MIEFEVMIRQIKALAALGEEIGNRIGPADAVCGRFGLIWRF